MCIGEWRSIQPMSAHLHNPSLVGISVRASEDNSAYKRSHESVEEWRLLEQTLNVSLPMAQKRLIALESCTIAERVTSRTLRIGAHKIWKSTRRTFPKLYGFKLSSAQKREGPVSLGLDEDGGRSWAQSGSRRGGAGSGVWSSDYHDREVVIR